MDLRWFGVAWEVQLGIIGRPKSRYSEYWSADLDRQLTTDAVTHDDAHDSEFV